MCFLKELRPLANVSIFSVCHVHGHASLFLDRLGFQYKLNAGFPAASLKKLGEN